jgi:RHS repeat-associated protein
LPTSFLTHHFQWCIATTALSNRHFQKGVPKSSFWFHPPFGLNLQGGDFQPATPDNFKYSQNEQQNDFGINLYDFGARLSDPTTGNRFLQIDPLAEISRRFSPYIYANSNPMRFIDPDGMSARDVETYELNDGTTVSYDVNTQKTLGYDTSTQEGGDGDEKNQKASAQSSEIGNKPPQSMMVGQNVYKRQDDGSYQIQPNGVTPDYTLEGAYIGGKVLAPVFGWFGKLFGGVFSKAAPEIAMTTVGRWMSKTEYEMMAKTGQMVEGAGGQTFVSTGGPGAFNAASKGSVFAEFQVPTNSLLQGGQSNWFKVLGPSAKPNQLYLLNKQGGQLLPQIQNLSPILKIK